MNRYPTATQSTSDYQNQTTHAVRTRYYPLPIVYPKIIVVSSTRDALRSASQTISPVPLQFWSHEVSPPSTSITPVENRDRDCSDISKQALSTAKQVVSDVRRPPHGSFMPTVFYSSTQSLYPDPSDASLSISVSTREDRKYPQKLI